MNAFFILENPLSSLEFPHHCWQAHQQLIYSIVELKLFEGI